MIKINLLPQELRKKKGSSTRIPFKPLLILGGVLFLLLTFFFYGDYLKAHATYKTIRREWLRLNPLMAQLKSLETKIEVEMRGEKEFLEKNVLNTDSMASLLSCVSEYLPKKGWITELSMDRQGEGFSFVLKGVVLPTRTQTGIEQIEEYLHKLKIRLPPKTTLELTTAKEVSAKVEGTSFTAQFDWGVVKKK